MKRAIKASYPVDIVDDAVELVRLLSKCEDLCSYLEDEYFGKDVVDNYIKCWKGLQTAKNAAKKALVTITTNPDLTD